MDVRSVPARKLDLDKYRNVLFNNLEASLIRCNQDLSRPFAYFEKSHVVQERIQTVPLTNKKTLPEDEKKDFYFNLVSLGQLGSLAVIQLSILVLLIDENFQ